MVKNPLANAGDTGLISGPGAKIPHSCKQLSCAQLLSHHSRARALQQKKIL